MPKILIVALVYALLYFISDLEGSMYYFMCSIVYSMISISAGILYIKTNSKLLLLYCAVNLLTSVVHFLLPIGWYGSLSYSLWYAPLNLSLIVEVIELMLVSSGVASIVISIINISFTNTCEHQGFTSSMVKIK